MMTTGCQRDHTETGGPVFGSQFRSNRLLAVARRYMSEADTLNAHGQVLLNEADDAQIQPS